MSRGPRQKILATISRYFSPSIPWAHFLTIKSCVYFQTHEPNELCPPQLAPGWSLHEKIPLYAVFLPQSKRTSENSKAHKTEMRRVKMKTVRKRLERYPEITITSILGIRNEAPATLMLTALQMRDLPLLSTAPNTHPKPWPASPTGCTSLQRHPLILHFWVSLCLVNVYSSVMFVFG